MVTARPASPVATPIIRETGPVTMPTAITSITIATSRIQNPAYLVTIAGSATTGEAYTGAAGPCGRSTGSADTTGAFCESAVNGVPQLAQNFASAEFCDPQ